MLTNYFRIATRNLNKYRQYSAINIVGLAFGIAVNLLILLYVQDEFSYDRFWKDSGRIHQMNTVFNMPDAEGETVSSRVGGRLKEALKLSFPAEIEFASRFNRLDTIVRHDGNAFGEPIHWVDPDAADIFDLEFIRGDLHTALKDNKSLVISESFALKYFGASNPIDRILTVTAYDLERDFRIAAVFRDLPHNTTLDFQALALIDETDFVNQPWEFSEWFSANGWLYLKLAEGVSIESINARLPELVKTQIDVPSYISANPDADASAYIGYLAQPLMDIQLTSLGSGPMKPTGDLNKVMIFIAIASLILLVSCVNFVNLTTAKSTQRAREVAIRKVVGARRGQLIAQFAGESAFLILMALFLSLVIVELAHPVFEAVVDRKLDVDYTNGNTLGLLAGLLVVTGVVAGIYPAFVLSSFLPGRMLKANRSTETRGSSWLRQILVVFQFAVSIGFIVAAGAIYIQMLYVTNMDIGFNKENLLSIHNVGRKDTRQLQKTLREEIMRLPGVTGASYAANRPAGGYGIGRSVTIPEEPERGSVSLAKQNVDVDFLETYQIRLIAGRNYNRKFALDGTPSARNAKPGQILKGTVLVNESAVARLGFGSADAALGRLLRIAVARKAGKLVYADLEIIGVVADILFHRPRGGKPAEAYYLEDNDYRSLVVRFDGDPTGLVERIENIWKTLIQTVPFQYEYVDEAIAEKFDKENNLAMLLGFFALLAVTVSCLGLYSLASYLADRRTREIGIRKVLGATAADIVRLLIWQFSKPVLVANIVAWPIAIWGLAQWLQTFIYRIDAWWLLPLATMSGVVAFLIAWATVGSNAARVARTSPVHALRYE